VNSGNLILSGANDYQGGTGLTAGTITVRDSNTALGRASSRLTATGGTSLVAGTSGLNLANVATLLTGNLTVDPGAGASTLQLSGVIDGVGGITKVNRGNLILSGNNSYAGGTGLTAGTITVNTATASAGTADPGGPASCTTRRAIAGAGSIHATGQGARRANRSDSNG
jgi:autotransporter-associated beta strand protein